MLLLANSSAALLTSFFCLSPMNHFMPQDHEHKFPPHSRSLNCVLREPSGSKDPESNITDKKTKPSWFRPGYGEHWLRTKESEPRPPGCRPNPPPPKLPTQRAWRMRLVSRIRWCRVMELKEQDPLVLGKYSALLLTGCVVWSKWNNFS